MHETPLFEGVVTCLLVALSLLTLLGLRHPARMLPVLLVRGDVEGPVVALVAVPAAAAGDMSPELREVVVSHSLAIIVVAVIPGRPAWQRFATSAGDPWR